MIFVLAGAKPVSMRCDLWVLVVLPWDGFLVSFSVGLFPSGVGCRRLYCGSRIFCRSDWDSGITIELIPVLGNGFCQPFIVEAPFWVAHGCCQLFVVESTSWVPWTSSNCMTALGRLSELQWLQLVRTWRRWDRWRSLRLRVWGGSFGFQTYRWVLSAVCCWGSIVADWDPFISELVCGIADG